MNEAEIIELLKGVIEETFGARDVSLSRETTALDIDGWDSLTHVHFVLNVEKRFRVRLPLERTYGMKNIGELADLLASVACSKP